MAQKALESVVRDLQKVIGELVNKISTLERKIDDQSVLINKQDQALTSLKTAVEGKLDPVPVKPPIADVQAPPALQRPVRQARLNAAAAKLVSGHAAAAKKPAAGLQCASLSSSPKTSETCRTATKSAPLPNTRATVTEGEPGQVDTAPPTSDNDKNGDHDEWNVVGRQHRRNQRPITVGTGNEIDDLQAVERMMFIQAWSFKPDTTTEKVLSFLNNIHTSTR
ncbi:Uncharacterized protein OBRU01_25637, partial [Operophtera brumata]